MPRRDDDDDDDQNYKYSGERGAAFRPFKRDFLARAQGKFSKDDQYSYYKAYMRMDEGGTGQGAPALPAQQGGA